MSKEQVYYIVGPIMFAKVFPGNLDKGQYAPEGGQYTIDVGVDKDDKKLIKSWNKRYSEKEYKAPYDEGVDPDLDYFQFKRKNVVLKRDGTEITEWGGPPRVVDSNNKDWDGRGLIGNGSICTLKLSVFKGINADSQAYTTVRLDGVRVDEWVEYKPENTQSDEGQEDSDRPEGMPF